ncbi:hypothetical protein BDB00DRAFT_783545 [Zychaea mexicana]|uniref:uncharacterized protein n=1 Tax=Zychaea mexicana TaxID=64656 RepID=UPI0022FE761A|nr:uncharacterized protein BDB00DRAFT_783545 [Zychaea mexicana]KAI9498932.1 hypothetical protein BDB00DRAFT_783545 [Zychaea mexicana]
MSSSEEEYEVERIVKHRNVTGKHRFQYTHKLYRFASNLVDAYWDNHGGSEALEAARNSKKLNKLKPAKKDTKKNSNTAATGSSSSSSKSHVKEINKKQQPASVASNSSSPASSSKSLSSVPTKRDRNLETYMEFSDNDSSKRARLPSETDKEDEVLKETEIATESTTIMGKDTPAAEVDATASSSVLSQLDATINATDAIADEISSTQVEVDTTEQQQNKVVAAVSAPSPSSSSSSLPLSKDNDKLAVTDGANDGTRTSTSSLPAPTAILGDTITDASTDIGMGEAAAAAATTEGRLSARKDTPISATIVDSDPTTKRNSSISDIANDLDTAVATTITTEATKGQKRTSVAEKENAGITQDDEDLFMDDVMDKPAASPTTLADATLLLDMLDDENEEQSSDISPAYDNGNSSTTTAGLSTTSLAAAAAANKENKGRSMTEDKIPPRVLEKDTDMLRGGDDKLLSHISPYDSNVKGLTELNTDEVIYDANFPASPEDWVNVKEVATVTRVPDDDGLDGDLYVVVRWANDVLSLHPNENARKHCPSQLIDFYEKSLKFVV